MITKGKDKAGTAGEGAKGDQTIQSLPVLLCAIATPPFSALFGSWKHVTGQVGDDRHHSCRNGQSSAEIHPELAWHGCHEEGDSGKDDGGVAVGLQLLPAAARGHGLRLPVRPDSDENAGHEGQARTDGDGRPDGTADHLHEQTDHEDGSLYGQCSTHTLMHFGSFLSTFGKQPTKLVGSLPKVRGSCFVK